MEPAAARQWATVAMKFIDGELTAEQFASEKANISGGDATHSADDVFPKPCLS